MLTILEGKRVLKLRPARPEVLDLSIAVSLRKPVERFRLGAVEGAQPQRGVRRHSRPGWSEKAAAMVASSAQSKLREPYLDRGKPRP